MNCKHCGAPLEEGALFCGNCGAKFEDGGQLQNQTPSGNAGNYQQQGGAVNNAGGQPAQRPNMGNDQVGGQPAPRPNMNNTGAQSVQRAKPNNTVVPPPVRQPDTGGSSLREEFMFCGNCGSRVEKGSPFCGECGARLDGSSPARPAAAYSDMEYKNGRKKTPAAVIILIVVLALAVIGGGAWLAISMLGGGSEEEDVPVPATVQSTDTAKEQSPASTPAATPTPTPTPTPAPAQEQAQSTGDYLFNSDTEYITEEYLNTKTRDEVRLILNEIYARNGYIFTTDTYIDYFSNKSWYTPRYASADDAEKAFNAIEQSNKTTIVNYEKAKGWR